MVPKRIARGRALFVVLGTLLGSTLGACGTSPRPPAAATSAGASSDAGADQADEEEDDVADADGDVEASSELAAQASSPCPPNMVLVETAEARFCIDKYEASLVEVDGSGGEKPFPHWLAVDGHTVRAVSQADVFPQAFISENQAEDACAASGKRLCSYGEWKKACMGPSKTTFPYGDARRAGVCHDSGKSAVAAVFGSKALADPVASAAPTKPTRVASSRSFAPSRGSTSAASKPGAKPSRPGRQAHVTTKGRAAETTRTRAARPGSAAAKSEKPSKRRSDKSDKSGRTAARGTKRVPSAAKASTRPASVEQSVWTQLNDPRLGQVEGALAKTGSHEACVNGYGALDMVGNLHEWVKTDPSAPHGTFAGGYFLDTTINGEGCQYRTTAHAHDYHDYSTGFRCCAEARAPETASASAD